MKRFFAAIGRFFLPPADAKTFIRILPLLATAVIMLVIFVFANNAWEQSNSPVFCGTTCHTMPPEYVTYSNSSHTNIACEDCHMGRGTLSLMVYRKVAYSWQTGSAMVLNTYKYPIFAKNMLPSRDACENCHKPEKFSTDKLVELKHFAADDTNTPTSTYLVLHTGGGLARLGLGKGIHWHIENKVQYYATDAEQQNIPYIVVTKGDGSKVEYTDATATFDASKVTPAQLKTMECITCHNRTAHLVDSPDAAMDDLLNRGLVSPKIPEIKKKGVEVLTARYTSDQTAMSGIAALTDYYQKYQSDFYTAQGGAALLNAAIKNMQDTWKSITFIDQKVDWTTHPNNMAHKDFAGCFRCHDGKHVTKDKLAIRLECNLCHSVPVASSAAQLTADIQISKGSEPDTHKNPNWIILHNKVFRPNDCKGCHTVDDPGGTSNKSYCSNSLCHGATYKFAGFDAPTLKDALAEQAKAMIPTPTPTVPPTPTPEGFELTPTADPSAATPMPTEDLSAPPTYAKLQVVMQNVCGGCHGDSGMKGLTVTTYAGIMKGSDSGAVVVAGSPDKSKIVDVQKAGGHPATLSAAELQFLIDWITAGAPEK